MLRMDMAPISLITPNLDPGQSRPTSSQMSDTSSTKDANSEAPQVTGDAMVLGFLFLFGGGLRCCEIIGLTPRSWYKLYGDCGVMQLIVARRRARRSSVWPRSEPSYSVAGTPRHVILVLFAVLSAVYCYAGSPMVLRRLCYADTVCCYADAVTRVCYADTTCCHAQIKYKKTTRSVQTVPGMRVFPFDFAVSAVARRSPGSSSTPSRSARYLPSEINCKRPQSPYSLYQQSI